MADSIYDSIYGAGASTGEYQASLYSAAAEKEMIGTIQQTAEMKQRNTERMIGNLQGLVSAGSQLYGGWKDKQIFEKRTLPSMEKTLGKQAWEKMDIDERVKTAKRLGMSIASATELEIKDLDEDVQEKYFKEFELKKDDQTTLGWISGQDRTYTFGKGKDARTLTKSDIKSLDLYNKYGMGSNINMDDFLSKKDETPLPSLWKETWQGFKGWFD